MSVNKRNECEEIYEYELRRWVWWDLYGKWERKIV